jgi:DNA polymerase III subunit delta
MSSTPPGPPPFLFSPWRVIFVRAPERKPDPDKSPAKEPKLISAVEEKILAGYFADPPQRTVIVLHLPGKLWKGTAAVRFLSSLPGVVTKEARPLKEKEIRGWIEAKARSLGKAVAPDAWSRLFEIVGNDLRRLDNEIEKLAVFVDEEKIITAAAVDQATAWVRDFDPYELDDALGGGDLRRALIVLEGLFNAGEKPERILGRLSDFVRNILAAKVQIAEKGRSRKEIFKELHPRISETWHGLFERKLSEFGAAVDGLSVSEVRRLLEALTEVDLRIKSTDADRRTAFDAFLVVYCGLRKRVGATSRASGRPWRPAG